MCNIQNYSGEADKYRNNIFKLFVGGLLCLDSPYFSPAISIYFSEVSMLYMYYGMSVFFLVSELSKPDPLVIHSTCLCKREYIFRELHQIQPQSASC